MRWLHIYTSMVSLVAVLFFALTGVTLNHPDWLAGETTKKLAGQMPSQWRTTTGVDWLVVAAQLQKAQGVHGTFSDRREEGDVAAITFKAPGYAAECVIDARTGTYELTVDYQGAVGVLNDLHRGRDAGGVWGVFIDLIGYFLAFVAVTGLGLLVYLKKVRARAFVMLAVGAGMMLVIALWP